MIFSALKKTFMVIGICLLLAHTALADIQTIIFNHSETKISHLLVAKGSEVDLKNDNQSAVYNVSLINEKSGKSLVSVAEISAGGSFRLEFGREGQYRLYHSLQRDESEVEERYVLINVISARPA
mgnify:CR=1 FL=1